MRIGIAESRAQRAKREGYSKAEFKEKGIKLKAEGEANSELGIRILGPRRV